MSTSQYTLVGGQQTDGAATHTGALIVSRKLNTGALVSVTLPDDLGPGSITSAKIADGTIATVDLADGAVTSAKILDGTIGAVDMAAGAASANVGTLGGVLGGTLPSPTMAAGAAATNVGTLGGVLSGTLPNPTLATGSVTSTMILDGTIGPLDVAAHAITQPTTARGVASSPTTTSTSPVDLPDLVITTPTTLAGIDLMAWFSVAILHNTLGAQVPLQLNLDGTDTAILSVVWAPAVGGIAVGSGAYTWSSVSAASHTIKARWYTSSGTATAFATYRELIVLQLNR